MQNRFEAVTLKRQHLGNLIETFLWMGSWYRTPTQIDSVLATRNRRAERHQKLCARFKVKLLAKGAGSLAVCLLDFTVCKHVQHRGQTPKDTRSPRPDVLQPAESGDGTLN